MPAAKKWQMPGETVSAEHAASLVQSGMWLDYGASHCQPDVFDKALAARKDELQNVRIRSCLSLRPLNLGEVPDYYRRIEKGVVFSAVVA
jgi:acyl-CoA hydrolase